MINYTQQAWKRERDYVARIMRMYFRRLFDTTNISTHMQVITLHSLSRYFVFKYTYIHTYIHIYVYICIDIIVFAKHAFIRRYKVLFSKLTSVAFHIVKLVVVCYIINIM